MAQEGRILRIELQFDATALILVAVHGDAALSIGALKPSCEAALGSRGSVPQTLSVVLGDFIVPFPAIADWTCS